MHKCPICGEIYCDHTPEERGETQEEIMMTDQQLFEKGRKEQGGFRGCM